MLVCGLFNLTTIGKAYKTVLDWVPSRQTQVPLVLTALNQEVVRVPSRWDGGKVEQTTNQHANQFKTTKQNPKDNKHRN